MNKHAIQSRSVLVLIGCALLMHILIFNRHPLQYDELLATDLVMRQSLPDLMNYLLNVELQMPLPYLWSKAVDSLFGPSSFWLRLPSLILVLLTPFVYLRLSKRILSIEESRWSLLVFLLSHSLFLFSTSMRPYAPIVFLSIVTLDYTLGLLDPRCNLRDKLILISALTVMVLLHPFSFVWLTTLYILYVFLLPAERRSWSHITKPMLPILFIAYIRWPTIAYALNSQLNWNALPQHVYRMSFLFSGGVAGVLSFAVITFGFIRARKSVDRSTWGLILIFLGSLMMSCLLAVIFSNHLFPRHFIYLLPLIPILTIRAMRSFPKWLSLSFTICLILVLLYKSFLQEKIHSEPPEIDTNALVEQARTWSGPEHIVLSCGNCFAFYLGTQNHQCTRTRNELESIAPKGKDFVLIVASFADISCLTTQELINHLPLESFQSKGGMVYRMSPRDNL